jgi:hypothetical protein
VNYRQGLANIGFTGFSLLMPLVQLPDGSRCASSAATVIS